MRILFISINLIYLTFSCGNSDQKSDADILLENVYASHGTLGDYAFTFRENEYSFAFSDSGYTYTKTVQNDSLLIEDVLTNEGFTRHLNGDLQSLSQEDSDKHAESLNSVIYFTCLPLKLNDPAVNKTLKGETTIGEQSYHVMEVTFDEIGGGKDHEDIFYYWFNSTTSQMDYMAYSYQVNGGGVRFRSAYNSRNVDGMRFQDYVNYGAPAQTPLENLPVMYDNHELEELSVIEVENVRRF